jgi:UDP-glucose 4-epimerase
MNLFVTGGAGYIGSVFVEEAVDAGHRVFVFDNLSEGHRGAVDERAEFIQGDLADESRLHEAVRQSGAEAVVHFAANALVGESMTNPGKYFGNNVGNGVKLLNAAVAAGARKFVFSSTCATYGPPERVPITEDTPQRPINPYGESKLMFEKILGWYQQLHGLDFVAFRYFNAAGAGRKFGEHHRVETHLIPNVLKVALGQSPHCEIYGTDYPTPDGTCIRDYIHILDLADAHLKAMEALDRGVGGVFNLGNGAGFSVREVIAAAEAVTGRPIRARVVARRPGDPPSLIAGSRRAMEVLGWNPSRGRLEEILESAWKWHRRHPDGYGD